MNTYGITNAVDSLMDNVTLGDGSSAADTTLSTAFKYKHTNYNTRIIVVADTEITVAQTKNLQVNLSQSATSDGTYTYFASGLNLTAPTGGKVYAIGDIIAEIVIPDKLVTSGNYIKLGITTNEDQDASKVTAFTTNCY